MSNKLIEYSDEIVMYIYSFEEKTITFIMMSNLVNQSYKKICRYLSHMLKMSLNSCKNVFDYLIQIHNIIGKTRIVIDKTFSE